MTAPVLTEPDALAPAHPSLAARLVRGVLPYVLALVLAFVVAGIVIAALGYDPFQAYQTIFTTSFKTGFGFTETLTKWVPLTLLALGFTIPLAVGAVQHRRRGPAARRGHGRGRGRHRLRRPAVRRPAAPGASSPGSWPGWSGPASRPSSWAAST